MKKTRNTPHPITADRRRKPGQRTPTPTFSGK